jgi:hypothetical protein
MIAKCANPVCRTDFDHLIGGRFFRFRLIEAEVSVIPGATQNTQPSSQPPLLGASPLRTGLDSFPSSGSSIR